MFFLNRKLTTRCLLVLAAAALVVRQAVCDNFQPNNGSFSTAPPKGVASASASAAVAIKKQPAPATTAAPPAPAPPPPPLPAAPLGPATTAKPAANAAPAALASASSAAGAAASPEANNTTPGEKLAQYFEPICDNMHKLSPEHFFKVQFQLKQFIEKTAGKMSVCFMQHYMIDPNLTPVDKSQLNNICASRNLAADAKGSFKNFQACAHNNWDKNLDQDIDRIIRLRSNCFWNHSHSKNDSTVNLVHDSDDILLIGEVVSKVLNDNKSNTVVNTNITMTNVGPSPAPSEALAPVLAPTRITTETPAAVASLASTSKTTAPPAAGNQSTVNKKILNDPNTLLVFIDDSAPTTPAPAATNKQVDGTLIKAAPSAPASSGSGGPSKTTLKPVPKLTTAVPSPTPKNEAHDVATKTNPGSVTSVKLAPSSLAEKILNASNNAAASTPAPPTSAKPATTSKPADATHPPKGVDAEAKKSTITVATTTIKPTTLPASATLPPTSEPHAATAAITAKPAVKNPSTTSKPAATTAKPAVITAKPQTTKGAATSAKPTGSAASSKPVATSSRPQDEEKQDKELKMKQLKQEQDEKDAKDAIKALQIQRAGHAADARLHQIEHERQMAIDPVGHTLKHQRYEQMKQQRTSTKPQA